jgi:RNA polymerase sigma-70 factor (ECF subfamily)
MHAKSETHVSNNQMTTNDFDLELKSMLPRLRIYAQSLTRDGGLADTLVQQTALKAQVDHESFRPGENFAAWLFSIQRNEFISGLRHARPTVGVDDVVTDTLRYKRSDTHPQRV